jgi:hypothetical protein
VVNLDESHEQAYEVRAFAMAVAEEVETLGRACATRIVADLETGERVRFTPHGTWVLFADDRPAYALEWHRRDGIRLIVFASGQFIASVLDATATATLASVSGTSSTLRTGGISRSYDGFIVAIPATEPIVLYSGRKLEIRHDSTERESSAGGTWGRPQSYRGSRFKVGPAGSENRTTRTVVLAHRNNLDAGGEWEPLTDQLTLEATFSPRCSVVPRV